MLEMLVAWTLFHIVKCPSNKGIKSKQLLGNNSNNKLQGSESHRQHDHCWLGDSENCSTK